MTDNEKFFVSLISSHLNHIPPEEPTNIDWEEIYRLSNIHNVTAMVTNQILLLPADKQPEKALLSKFRQQTGYTLIDSDSKDKVLNELKRLFTDSEIEYLPVKGSVIRNYYPVKEFRTSGDIDFIVKYDDLDRVRHILKNKNIKLYHNINYVFTFDLDDQHIEVHSNLDCDHPYFENIFDMCEKCGYECKINDETHLLYVLCHIIKHFNICGAGIKMFMDIDVIVRHISELDYTAFIKKCRELKIETFAKASLSLCNYWFNTPVKAEIDFNENTDLRELFENEIINSGSFGFNKRNLGDYYISKGIGKSGKNNIFSKLKAFLILLFPGKAYLKEGYKYLQKYPFLLPIAWLNRLYRAVFKRGTHSVGTIKSILRTGNESEQYKKLLNELDI